MFLVNFGGGKFFFVSFGDNKGLFWKKAAFSPVKACLRSSPPRVAPLCPAASRCCRVFFQRKLPPAAAVRLSVRLSVPLAPAASSWLPHAGVKRSQLGWGGGYLNPPNSSLLKQKLPFPVPSRPLCLSVRPSICPRPFSAAPSLSL